MRGVMVAYVIAFVVAYMFAQDLFVLLARPLIEVWRAHEAAGAALGPPTFYFASLTEPLWAYMRQSAWAAAFLAFPFLAHQLSAFVAPSWKPRSRLAAFGFAGVAGLIFIAGAAFCYLTVMPLAFDFFLRYSTHNIPGSAVSVGLQPRLFIADYMSFARALMVGFGLVFELPVVIYGLVSAGLVTHRGLWRFNRAAIVIAFTVSAVLTPGPDVLSQMLMAVPLVVLYNLSILVAYVVVRRREAAQRRAEEQQVVA
jgi:sec-independent protein translocase protein TatC